MRGGLPDGATFAENLAVDFRREADRRQHTTTTAAAAQTPTTTATATPAQTPAGLLAAVTAWPVTATATGLPEGVDDSVGETDADCGGAVEAEGLPDGGAAGDAGGDTLLVGVAVECSDGVCEGSGCVRVAEGVADCDAV